MMHRLQKEERRGVDPVRIQGEVGRGGRSSKDTGRSGRMRGRSCEDTRRRGRMGRGVDPVRIQGEGGGWGGRSSKDTRRRFQILN